MQMWLSVQMQEEEDSAKLLETHYAWVYPTSRVIAQEKRTINKKNK